MRKLLAMVALLLFCAYAAFAQTVVVQGRVADENGPVPNATIQEKGTKNTVTADANGSFSIKVKQGARLVITAVGYETTEVDASSNVRISLKIKADELQEVLVTTAFNVKKSQRTTVFSSQVVKAEQLNVIRQPNLNNALAGKVAGVQFRGQSSAKLNDQGFLRIRGGGSLGDVGAIYVVDGTITNSFDINPDDVQDITILKGANATVLFGARAVNGAVVITTKKGVGAKKGIGVEVNQGVTFDKAAYLPKYQNEYGGGDGDWLTFTYNSTMPAEWQALNGKKYRDFTDDASWGPRIDGSEYIPWYAFIPGHERSGKTAAFTAQPNNVRDFWRTGVTNNTNVSFTQNNGAGQSMRVSYSNQSIKGMLPNSKSLRHNLASNFSMDLGRFFTVGANINYTNQLIQGEFGDGYANNSGGNFNQWMHRDLDMNILRELSGLKTPIGTLASWNFRRNPGSWNAANPRSSVWAANYWYNPYTVYENTNYQQRRDRLYGDANMTVKFNSNLRFKGTVRTDQFNGNVENILPNILEYSGGQTGYLAYYGTSNTINREWNFEGLLTYDKTFGDLAVNVNAGANRLQIRQRAAAANTNSGLSVPELYAISNSKTTPTVSNSRSDQQANSLFAFGDFEYKKFASVSWAVRNDWYSTLPAGNNDLLLPSVGASFIFSEFTKNKLPWLSFGKVFGSYGKKPVPLNPYELNLNYSVNPLLWGSNFLMTTPNSSIAPDLRGATTTTWEAGIDLRLFKNRMNLNITYYYEDNKDLPLSVAVSGISGFTSQRINAAWVQRSGLEVELGGSIIKSKDFNWNANTTFAYILSNPVKALAPGLPSFVLSQSAFTTRFARTIHFKDETWGQLTGGGIARNADGQPLLTAAGLYTADANKRWGSVIPKITGGLQNFFTYKNFTLGLTMDYQFGGKFFSLSEQWGTFSGLLDETAGLNDKGNPKRDPVASGGGVRVQGVSAADGRTPVDTYVEAYDYYHQFYFGRISEPFVHSLTYGRLREASLGYAIPVQKLGKFGQAFQGAQLSVTGRNLFFFFRDAKNFDPSEISGVNGEDGQLVGARSFGFNLKLNF